MRPALASAVIWQDCGGDRRSGQAVGTTDSNLPATRTGETRRARPVLSSVSTNTAQSVLVANLMGRLFMDALDDPFAQLEELLERHRLGSAVAASVIDVHAEATSEKMALAHLADGRASLVVGTHSHVPTADAQRLPGGTAYQTDAGMCGDYDSVIGMQKQAALQRFRTKLPGEKLAPAEGPATLCGVYVETDAKSGLARNVAPLRLGGRLVPAWPDAGARPLWAQAAE